MRQDLGLMIEPGTDVRAMFETEDRAFKQFDGTTTLGEAIKRASELREELETYIPR